ncbi:MAG: hypothetical protein MI976_26355 [Pseudomonadales bacterium]|nr:hypothetical protein [Pseudomonadales bacterium]
MINLSTKRLLWYLLSGIWLLSAVAFPVHANSEVLTLTEQEAIEKAKAYYDTKGEWAGKFTITKVHQVRFEPAGPNSLVAHIRYQAGFLMDLSRVVEDQRTFTFLHASGWVVTAMGGHKSARF